jgi:hypothetical protein
MSAPESATAIAAEPPINPLLMPTSAPTAGNASVAGPAAPRSGSRAIVARTGSPARAVSAAQ